MARILFVDDEEMMCFLAEFFFKGSHEIFTARNGCEGLIKFENYRPHLIITDLNMPIMGGLEMISAVRLHPEGQNVKIIAISCSFKDEEHMEQVRNIGADLCLEKPLDLPQFNDYVQEILMEQSYSCLLNTLAS